jgi:hypothetical protein
MPRRELLSNIIEPTSETDPVALSLIGSRIYKVRMRQSLSERAMHAVHSLTAFFSMQLFEDGNYYEGFIQETETYPAVWKAEPDEDDGRVQYHGETSNSATPNRL